MAGQRARGGGTSPPPHADQVAGDAASRAACPDQFERRKQPPALVAPQDAARDQLTRHRRGVQPLPAEPAGDPQPFPQLTDLRHAMHGHPDGATEDVGYSDLAKLRKNGGDPVLDGRAEPARPRIPGRFRTGPHQAVAVHDPEMVDAVAVANRSGKGNSVGEARAERFGHGAIAPDRQQGFRQPPQRRAEMNVAGQHDMRCAKPRRWRHDAFANARRIDADHGRILEDARPCPPCERRQAMDIFAAVDLKRLGIIDAVEITPGLDLLAYPIDLPAFDLGLEILAQRLQPADQRFAGIDVGDFQRAFGQCNARHRLLGREAANVIGALLRQRPELAGILEADALDQLTDRQAVARHDRAELVAGRVPADVAAFEHGNAGAETRGLQRHGQAGKPGPDHADIDIEVERQAGAKGCVVVGAVGRACESLWHGVFLRTAAALVTLSKA